MELRKCDCTMQTLLINFGGYLWIVRFQHQFRKQLSLTESHVFHGGCYNISFKGVGKHLGYSWMKLQWCQLELELLLLVETELLSLELDFAKLEPDAAASPAASSASPPLPQSKRSWQQGNLSSADNTPKLVRFIVPSEEAQSSRTNRKGSHET